MPSGRVVVVVSGAVVVVEVRAGYSASRSLPKVVVVGRVVVVLVAIVVIVTGGVTRGPLGKTALMVERLFKP
jgi:hypothetical protein